MPYGCWAATSPLRPPSPGLLLARQRVRIPLYKAERLTVRKRGGRERGTGHKGADGNPAGSEPALVARLRDGYALQRPALPRPAPGRRLHLECLGLVVDNSLTALRVVREIDQIIESRGCPPMIVSDNEFTSTAS